jgi:epoxyqueuosine reductase
VTKTPELQPRTPLVNPDLEWLAGLSLEEFREVFRGSPVKRARFNGLRRNIAIALGNSDEERFVPVLEELSRDEDVMVADHARWALQRLRDELRRLRRRPAK